MRGSVFFIQAFFGLLFFSVAHGADSSTLAVVKGESYFRLFPKSEDLQLVWAEGHTNDVYSARLRLKTRICPTSNEQRVRASFEQKTWVGNNKGGRNFFVNLVIDESLNCANGEDGYIDFATNWGCSKSDFENEKCKVMVNGGYGVDHIIKPETTSTKWIRVKLQ